MASLKDLSPDFRKTEEDYIGYKDLKNCRLSYLSSLKLMRKGVFSRETSFCKAKVLIPSGSDLLPVKCPWGPDYYESVRTNEIRVLEIKSLFGDLDCVRGEPFLRQYDKITYEVGGNYIKEVEPNSPDKWGNGLRVLISSTTALGLLASE